TRCWLVTFCWFATTRKWQRSSSRSRAVEGKRILRACWTTSTLTTDYPKPGRDDLSSLVSFQSSASLLGGRTKNLFWDDMEVVPTKSGKQSDLSFGHAPGMLGARARGGMADAPDLGSGSERIGGSSPLARTIEKRQGRPHILANVYRHYLD